MCEAEVRAGIQSGTEPILFEYWANIVLCSRTEQQWLILDVLLVQQSPLYENSYLGK